MHMENAADAFDHKLDRTSRLLSSTGPRMAFHMPQARCSMSRNIFPSVRAGACSEKHPAVPRHLNDSVHRRRSVCQRCPQSSPKAQADAKSMTFSFSAQRRRDLTNNDWSSALRSVACAKRLMWHQEAPPEMRDKARQWRKLSERHDVQLPAVALAFAALPAIVERVVLGMATKAQAARKPWPLTSTCVPHACHISLIDVCTEGLHGRCLAPSRRKNCDHTHRHDQHFRHSHSCSVYLVDFASVGRARWRQHASCVSRVDVFCESAEVEENLVLLTDCCLRCLFAHAV